MAETATHTLLEPAQQLIEALERVEEGLKEAEALAWALAEAVDGPPNLLSRLHHAVAREAYRADSIGRRNAS